MFLCIGVYDIYIYICMYICGVRAPDTDPPAIILLHAMRNLWGGAKTIDRPASLGRCRRPNFTSYFDSFLLCLEGHVSTVPRI